jgi:hypothetical protein
MFSKSALIFKVPSVRSCRSSMFLLILSYQKFSTDIQGDQKRTLHFSVTPFVLGSLVAGQKETRLYGCTPKCGRNVYWTFVKESILATSRPNQLSFCGVAIFLNWWNLAVARSNSDPDCWEQTFEDCLGTDVNVKSLIHCMSSTQFWMCKMFLCSPNAFQQHNVTCPGFRDE